MNALAWLERRQISIWKVWPLISLVAFTLLFKIKLILFETLNGIIKLVKVKQTFQLSQQTKKLKLWLLAVIWKPHFTDANSSEKNRLVISRFIYLNIKCRLLFCTFNLERNKLMQKLCLFSWTLFIACKFKSQCKDFSFWTQLCISIIFIINYQISNLYYIYKIFVNTFG